MSTWVPGFRQTTFAPPLEDPASIVDEQLGSVAGMATRVTITGTGTPVLNAADVLVYEAMRFDPIKARRPHLRYIADYHADTRLIGAQAAELDIPILMLTHLIPAPSSEADKQAFVDDVRGAGFTGELHVCEDLDVINLKKA